MQKGVVTKTLGCGMENLLLQMGISLTYPARNQSLFIEAEHVSF